MTHKEIINDYFEWLFETVDNERSDIDNSYRDLLIYLHDVDFICINPRDQDRAADGIDLRRRFALEYGFRDTPDCLDRPCSVLEMMIALAIRCEETIMDDTSVGDRTRQWFWRMISNLDLNSMTNRNFDIDYVEYAVSTFLYRDYEADGRGGLFHIRNCSSNLRHVEIWTQMLWYLDEYYSN